MKNIILLMLLLSPLITFSQSDSTKCEKIICLVSAPPSYPGGQDKMSVFIQENFGYPDSAIKYKEQVTVWVKFTVSEKGKVTNVSILKSVSSLIDTECIRVVKLMPDWIPGSSGGKLSETNYSLPIKINRP